MEIYRFSHPSPIARIECIQDAKKVWTTRLFPHEGASPEQLVALTEFLNRHKGIIATPETDNSVHTLFASGFRSPNELLNLLDGGRFSTGKPQHESLSEEKRSIKRTLDKISLKLSGIFYLISDAAIAMSGVMSGRKKEAAAGLLYASGGVVLSKYGSKDSHTHLHDLSIKLGDFFTAEGIKIPENNGIMNANRERSRPLKEGFERFAYAHPSQIFNSIVALAGIQIIQSGAKHHKTWDTASGMLVLGGATAGLLIPEKTDKPQMPEAEERKKSKPTRLTAWIREKPLRIPGLLWFGNNITFLFSALDERKKKPEQKSYQFKLIYVASAMAANALMFISSKEKTKRFDLQSDTMNALLSVAANVIMHQPAEEQERLIQQVASLVTIEGGLHSSAKDAADKLRNKISELENNPFIQQTNPSAKITEAPPSPDISEEQETGKKYTANIPMKQNLFPAAKNEMNSVTADPGIMLRH